MAGISRTTAKQSLARHNPEQQSSPTEHAASLAAYIADMTAELAELAGNARLPMLAYFLNLARVEAQIYARENDIREIARER
jgi:hypothetical protein